MKIDNDLLKKLEKLSYVTIDDAKRDDVVSQLSSIVSFVENLSELDDKLQSFTGHEEHASLHLRSDTPLVQNLASEMFPHAPRAADGFFIVPKIIE